MKINLDRVELAYIEREKEEIDYMLDQITLAPTTEDRARRIADLSVFFFRLGQDYATTFGTSNAS